MPRRSLVEAWTRWRLPFENLTVTQRSYRECLRTAIKGLGPADGVRASYRSTSAAGNVDVENVLFYNVSASPFKKIATKALSFERLHGPPPPPPTSLEFEPQHYVKYEVAHEDSAFGNVEGALLARSPLVVLNGIGELRDRVKLPRLWWLFKQNFEKEGQADWSRGEPFGVQMRITAPSEARLNLATIVKPLMDGFISALHCYEGKQLDEVANRLATILSKPVEDVRYLLLDNRNALLGPRAVPHLRGDGLQWSPSDHLMIAGEVIRETSQDGSIAIAGCALKQLSPFASSLSFS